MPAQIAVQMMANQLPFQVKTPTPPQKALLQEICLGDLKLMALPHQTLKLMALPHHHRKLMGRLH
jgi:hypothetical protein